VHKKDQELVAFKVGFCVQGRVPKQFWVVLGALFLIAVGYSAPDVLRLVGGFK
jgi:hypothetical protein